MPEQPASRRADTQRDLVFWLVVGSDASQWQSIIAASFSCGLSLPLELGAPVLEDFALASLPVGSVAKLRRDSWLKVPCASVRPERAGASHELQRARTQRNGALEIVN